MRAAVTHRHAEPLGRAHGDIGAHRARLFSRHSASRSVATTATPFASCSAAHSAVRSRIWPKVPGYWKIAPKTAAGSRSAGAPMTISMPSGLGRVSMTEMVCGCRFSLTKNALAFDLATRCAMAMASAAAVASSSNEALATGRPGQIGDHGLIIQQRLKPALAISG